MAVTHVQDEILALDRGAITNAVDFEVNRESFGHTLDDVVHQRPGRAPQRTRPLRVLQRGNDNTAAIHLNLDLGRLVRNGELTELTLRLNRLRKNFDGYTARHTYGIFTNARHCRLRSEYLAENLTANIGSAGLIVGHYAPRGREDRNPQPVVDARQVLDLAVHPPSRPRYPFDLLNHR